MTNMDRTKFGLPVLHYVGLRGFSLYTENPKIDLKIANGVSCLVGANGLGKSTFIAAVNFGICGRLPDPNERFQSADEYFQEVRTFSSTFFDGRINESDRSNAEIEVAFTIGDDSYHIVRGAFEPDELRYASRNNSELGNFSGSNPAEVNNSYKAAIAKSIGVSTFEQFVFLQLFIFTFDERRNLTFWQRPIQRQMLLLAFGDNVGDAQEAELLRRRIERLDSTARNLNYQATQTRKRLEDSQRILEGLSPETVDLKVELEELHRSLDVLQNRESEELSTLEDSKLRSAELRAEALSLRARIDEVFAQRGTRTADLKLRPVVADSLQSGSCNLCGAFGEEVVSGISSRIARPECPLCGVNLPTESSLEQSVLDIVALDEQLASIGDKIQEEENRQLRVSATADETQASIAKKLRRIGEIEKDNRHLTSILGISDVAEIQLAISSNQHTIRELIRERDSLRRERDGLRGQLQEIQARVSLQYSQVEGQFLGVFRKLAESFIGLDLDVKFASRGTDIYLVLEIANQPRRQQHQLSESQGFFVDIALRMAIATFIARDGTGTLLIDTPEGSLDIAYESRAGEMFASFVSGGYHIMMTANINTSQLLLELAARCGPENMHVERMTEWTTLSEVQLASEHLFNQAYDMIESKLSSDGEHVRSDAC